MILFKRSTDLSKWLNQETASGKSIGFVPTMGALHPGHISLITISKMETDTTVCSIFVNPTQFNDPKDFQKYPKTLEKDIALLEAAGVDVLFLPAVSELYLAGTANLEHYDLGLLETLLEGKYRPGHFQGVCQVMFRLLSIVRPDHLFMGQKDYQQCMVVQRLLTLMSLPVQLHRCPIVREADGLAMSSRNVRLNPAQRAKATAIYRALLLLSSQFRVVPTTALVAAGAILKEADFHIDYISVADSATLEPVSDPMNGAAMVALIAAFQGEVRLIDNMIL
ncbi:MAG TPA: pantoate--beta-alanine ligase [Puia sp.]|jgi:pantoate--beta-alanine ligase|nr:pantoate--beta-alanine ligase [Puia sp.]